MRRSIFPQLVEISEKKDKISYERKCLIHEKLLYRYLERKIEGWSVKNFFKGRENREVCVICDNRFYKFIYGRFKKK